ncbi:MAG: ParA family protein [Immundisolibacteraceae bacterium]|nr:ParA family protein [Immundisolibacteraceae bacterium]
MQIVAIHNIESGVGKTSTAVNLAWIAAKNGLRTLLWDLNSRAEAGLFLGANSDPNTRMSNELAGRVTLADQIIGSDYENLAVVPGRWAYRNLEQLINGAADPRRVVKSLLKPLADEYDLVVLDCPADEPELADSVLAAAEIILVPLIPGPQALDGWQHVLDICRNSRLPVSSIYPFLNMIDYRIQLHREWLVVAPAELPRLFSAYIPFAHAVERMSITRQPVAESDATDRVADAYQALWQELKRHLDEPVSDS